MKKFKGKIMKNPNQLADICNWRDKLWKVTGKEREKISDLCTLEDVQGDNILIYVHTFFEENNTYILDKEFYGKEELLKELKAFKNPECLKHLEVDLGKYKLFTGTGYINASIMYWRDEGLIELNQSQPENYWSKTYKVKNHNKAINLLKRAEEDFNKFKKNNSVPTLGTMQEKYINYFLYEVERSFQDF
jgi:hypothetical protein